MTVLNGVTGDLFRITVVKYLAANPDLKWSNNYEWRATADFIEGQLVSLGNVIVAFEILMHLTTVQFDRLRISTWEEDSVPYDPTSFISLPLNADGDVPLDGQQAVALNVCLDVGRLPASGRFGHLYYRGRLREGDVNAPAGKYVLSDPAGIATEVAGNLTTSGLEDEINGDGGPFEMVMINKTGSQVRRVLDLQRRGVAVVPFNHAWFNRTPTP